MERREHTPPVRSRRGGFLAFAALIAASVATPSHARIFEPQEHWLTSGHLCIDSRGPAGLRSHALPPRSCVPESEHAPVRVSERREDGYSVGAAPSKIPQTAELERVENEFYKDIFTGRTTLLGNPPLRARSGAKANVETTSRADDMPITVGPEDS